MNNSYEDIIHLPHPVSKKHPQMSIADRAAQFSPFAALTGYNEVVKETARLTENYREMDEEGKRILDQKLQWLRSAGVEEQEVTITYFLPDDYKEGGAYVEVSGFIKKFDTQNRQLIMMDGTEIDVDYIEDITSEEIQKQMQYE